VPPLISLPVLHLLPSSSSTRRKLSEKDLAYSLQTSKAVIAYKRVTIDKGP
jgi:hypothetical protein